VYNGQLDLICDTLGTEAWFYRLDVAEKFKTQTRKTNSCPGESVCFFSQTYKNVEFYWVLKAGHMVPSDNGVGALTMINMIMQ